MRYRIALLIAVFLPLELGLGGDRLAPGDKLPSLDVRWSRSDMRVRALVDEIGYAGTFDGRLLAFYPSSGAVRWDVPLSTDGTAAADGLVFQGDAIWIGCGEMLFKLDRKSGSVLRASNLGVRISRLLGPPLVAMVPGQHCNFELASIDEREARIRAIRPVTELMVPGEMVVCRGMVVGKVLDNRSGIQQDIMVGIRANDLKEVWRRSFGMVSFLCWLDGEPCLQYATEKGRRLARFDPLTGSLGLQLPLEAFSDRGDDQPPNMLPITTADDYYYPPSAMHRDPKTGQVIVDAQGVVYTNCAIRRHDPKSGRIIWSTALPAAAISYAVHGETLLAHCVSGRDTGIFVILDWRTGKIRGTARGFKQVRRMDLCRDVAIVETTDGGYAVLAFSTRQSGSSKALPGH